MRRDSDELSEVFGPLHLTPIRHARQRNQTWLLHGECGLTAVVKRYRSLSQAAISGVIDAENRARDAGVPVPRVLYRSPDRPLVVHAWVLGQHDVPRSFDLIDACAQQFVRHLRGLRGFLPAWTPPRPPQPPLRAREAITRSPDVQLSEDISASWSQLGSLASGRPTVASHADWRADNILILDGQVAAVLDWEYVVLLPAAEAVGYAAGSLTHSWRETLYQPLDLLPVTRFLDTAARCLNWEAGSLRAVNARLAAFHTCAVRLAEDQHRGCADSAITRDDLWAALG